MENLNFQVGDCVVIKTPENDAKTIGKIEDIFSEGEDKIIRYNEYYLPEKTSAGRQAHNSKNEVYKTEEIEKEFYSNIISKCEILKYEKFIKKLLILKEKKIIFPSALENVYFFRQKYSIGDDIYVPDLEVTCYCQKIFNPDKAFIQCKECKQLIHVDCLMASDSKRCFNSKCNSNLESQLQVINEPGEKFTGHKRERSSTEQVAKIAEQQMNIYNSNINKVSSAMSITSQPSLENVIEERSRFVTEDPKNSFPNLSESRRAYLVALIDKLEKATSNLIRSLPDDEKARRNTRDKICYSLLYGIEELKETGDWSKIKSQELARPAIPENTAKKICNILAIAIESTIFFQNNEIVNNNYKKKFRTLYINLVDSRNYELRFSIINGDVTPIELVKMTSDELAPSSLKSRRIERQNKYFKEQVLMREEAKIIAKTHKGESILTVDCNKDSSQNEGFLSYDLLNFNSGNSSEQKKNEDHTQDKKDNESEHGSWDYASDHDDRKAGVMSSGGGKNNVMRGGLPREDSGMPGLLCKTLSEKSIREEKEKRYKNLSHESMKFYTFLEEFTRDNLIHKINEKLKSHLKSHTVDEIAKMRKIRYNSESNNNIK